MNFIQQCLAGHVLSDEIDNFVEQWHEGIEGQDMELHDYLGMTWSEYTLWSTQPSVLPFILKAHKNNTSLDLAQNYEELAMVARASNAQEAHKMEAWLKSIGKL